MREFTDVTSAASAHALFTGSGAAAAGHISRTEIVDMICDRMKRGTL